jgi:hypothetical protein
MLNNKRIAAGAFYGRLPNARMPFYGQDDKNSPRTEGQRIKVAVKDGLLKQGDIGTNVPWTWSKAHMLIGDKDDTKKYMPKPDPLVAEDRIPVMKGWDHLASAYAVERIKSEIEYYSDLDKPSNADLAMMTALANEVAKGKRQSYEAEFHDEFAHRFREWLRGNGSNDEYYEAGMMSYVDGIGNKRATSKPISDHPSVLQYLADWQSRVIEFDRKRTHMKLRLGRQGPRGEAASIDDLWKYYKFVVYGVEATDQVLAEADDAAHDAHPPPAAAAALPSPVGTVPVAPAPSTPMPVAAPASPEPMVQVVPADTVEDVVGEIIDCHEPPSMDAATAEAEQQRRLAVEHEQQQQAERERLQKLEQDNQQQEAERQRLLREQELVDAAQQNRRLAETERANRELAQRNATELQRQLQEQAQALEATRKAKEDAEKLANDTAEQLRHANNALAGNQQTHGDLLKQSEAAVRDAVAQAQAQFKAQEALRDADIKRALDQQMAEALASQKAIGLTALQDAQRIADEKDALIAALNARLEQASKSLSDRAAGINFLRSSNATKAPTPVAPAPLPAPAPAPAPVPKHVLPHEPPNSEKAMQTSLTQAEVDAMLSKDREMDDKIAQDERFAREMFMAGVQHDLDEKNRSKRGRAPERTLEDAQADARSRSQRREPTPTPTPAPAATPDPSSYTAYQTGGSMTNNKIHYTKKDDNLKKSDMVAPDTPFIASKPLGTAAKTYHRKAYKEIAKIADKNPDNPDQWFGAATDKMIPMGTESMIDGELKSDIIRRYVLYMKGVRKANQ